MEYSNIEKVSQMLFPDIVELNKTSSQKFSDEIRNQIFTMRKQSWSRLYPPLQQELQDEAKYKELAEFTRKHLKNVGQQQS